MKKILLLIIVTLFFVGCEDNVNKFEFDILCGGKSSCDFYFFPDDDYYHNFEILDIGNFLKERGVLTNKKGERVESIGFAHYYLKDYATAKYMDWSKNGYKKPEIRKGTFYVVCVCTENSGRRFPYKAKTFTKLEDKALIIEPVFTWESSFVPYGETYVYYEWDE